MAEKPVFKAPAFDEVANYPLECRTRFLGLTAARQAARYHADKRAILHDIEQVLDEYLLWLEVYGT